MEITPTPRRAPYSSRTFRVLTNLAAVVALAAALGLLVPAALGLQRYVITGSSMSGTFEVGSLVLADVVPVSDLREGDVITYLPPAGSGVDHLLTHRIVSIEGDVFRTQGDALDQPDPWSFTLTQPRQARVEHHLPYVGHLFWAGQDRATRMLIIGVPAGLVAVLGLAQVLRAVRRTRGPRRPSAPGGPEPHSPPLSTMAAVPGRS